MSTKQASQPAVNRHRAGRFSMHSDVLNRRPQEAIQIFAMAGIVPFRAEMMFHRSEIEYAALCPAFDEISEGEAIPKYELIAQMDDDGNISRVVFERQEEP